MRARRGRYANAAAIAATTTLPLLLLPPLSGTHAKNSACGRPVSMIHTWIGRLRLDGALTAAIALRTYVHAKPDRAAHCNQAARRVPRSRARCCKQTVHSPTTPPDMPLLPQVARTAPWRLRRPCVCAKESRTTKSSSVVGPLRVSQRLFCPKGVHVCSELPACGEPQILNLRIVGRFR